jgi:hypothetical protein
MIDIFSPIQSFTDLVTYQLMAIAKGSYWGDSVNFFIYDVIKIGLLLLVINYVMAITRYYFPMEKVPFSSDMNRLIIWFYSKNK